MCHVEYQSQIHLHDLNSNEVKFQLISKGIRIPKMYFSYNSPQTDVYEHSEVD